MFPEQQRVRQRLQPGVQRHKAAERLDGPGERDLSREIPATSKKLCTHRFLFRKEGELGVFIHYFGCSRMY